MGRHKRIPTKNRKKLKSVDPFNKNAVKLKAEALSKINWEPKDDKQEMTRSQIELQKSKAKGLIGKTDLRRRKQCRNKVLAEAKRNGISKGRFETVQNFIRRVERMTYQAIKDHEILIKQGLVGREEADIATDFKLLEEKEKRQKEQIKNEIRNKIRAARQKREYHAKLKEEKLKEKTERKLKQSGEKRRNELVVEGNEKTENDFKEKNQEFSLLKQIDEEMILKKTRKKIGPSEKVRMKKKLAARHARTEAVLNQRELVEFGERYDAPPEYKGTMKAVMKPLMANAGAKDLLLRSLLPPKRTSTTMHLEENKETKPGEIDRQRVIDAYRKLKRKRASQI